MCSGVETDLNDVKDYVFVEGEEDDFGLSVVIPCSVDQQKSHQEPKLQ